MLRGRKERPCGRKRLRRRIFGGGLRVSEGVTESDNVKLDDTDIDSVVVSSTDAEREVDGLPLIVQVTVRV